MGIRIKKCVGYGFDDLVDDDPRIDFNIFRENIENSKEDFNTYLQLVKDNADTEFMMHDILSKTVDKPWDMYDKVIYDSEFGLSNLVLFIHPDAHDWYRSDDIIDFCESLEGDAYAAKSSRLSRGIYPYNIHDKLFHVPSGKLFNGRMIQYAKYAENESLKSVDGSEIEYYETIEDDCIPEVPLLIKHLAMYMGVDPLHVNCLRPLTYTYWS